jgi:PBSX family phage portal protein
MPETNIIPPRSHVTLSKKVLKADTKTLVVNVVLEAEDEFLPTYGEGVLNPGSAIVAPPFTLSTLSALVKRNNILLQCVLAMETNIDGTGYTLTLADPQSGDDLEEKKRLEAFFNEPFPGESFLSIRRKLRYDLETIGNAYLEVMRNPEGKILLLRHLDGLSMRLVMLDDPVSVEKTIVRFGENVTATYMARERRFAQKVGTKTIFFKEFGCSRDLNRETGRWAEGKLAMTDMASEVLHFTCIADTTTAYGLPRWINQLPSILGSRKGEEFNLEFFDSGGVPPAVVFVQGGLLTEDVRDQLQTFFSGSAKSKNRIAVVEVQASGGTLDSAGSVKVSTERFGDFRSQDSMFQGYDQNCEDHVRVAFRLPTLFLGKASDMNFATAMTSYMVAEAQVFTPERVEFDEIINKKLLPELGAKKYLYVSNPVNLRNVDIQMKALELGMPKISGEDFIKALNEIASLHLLYSEEAEKKNAEMAAPAGKSQNFMGTEGSLPTGKNNVRNDVEPVKQEPDRRQTVGKQEVHPEDIADLVLKWSVAVGLEDGAMSDPERLLVLSRVDALPVTYRRVFDNMLSVKTFVAKKLDGTNELAGCCADHMH